MNLTKAPHLILEYGSLNQYEPRFYGIGYAFWAIEVARLERVPVWVSSRYEEEGEL